MKCLVSSCAAAFVLVAMPAAAAGPGALHRADIAVVFSSAVDCEVTMAAEVEPSTSTVEHLVSLNGGSAIESVEATGAGVSLAPTTTRGRIVVVPVTVASGARASYRLRLRVSQPAPWAASCPLPVPTVPTDGRSREVQVGVTLPAGTMPLGDSFPTFAWEGSRGSVRIGHVPAFVRAPFATPGERLPLLRRVGLARIVDASAIAVLIAATALWGFVRRR